MEPISTRLEYRPEQGGLVTVKVLEDVKKAELYELEQEHSAAAQVLSEARERRQVKEAELAEIVKEEQAAEVAYNDSKSRLELGQKLVEEHAGDDAGTVVSDSQGEAEATNEAEGAVSIPVHVNF